MVKIDSSVQSAVYTALRNNIMSLQLKPGTTMSTQKIAEKLNVSRTPVREAFIRLQRDGLLDIFPQKETTVSRIDFSKVEQERFIRESLEIANAELFVKKVTKQDISELELNLEQQRATVQSCDYNALLQLDNVFHEYMFRATGQNVAWETIQATSNHYARIRLITVWNKDIMMETILQHQKILSAIQEQNLDFAKIYIKAHLHRLENQVQQLLEDYPDYFVQESIPAEEKFEFLLRQ
ncbi:MAG: GntR family transcriptional regulator [Treponema sp.]|nr:GntR family transcriptional regulator [Treponema sp.]